jgi:hypothetical protein
MNYEFEYYLNRNQVDIKEIQKGNLEGILTIGGPSGIYMINISPCLKDSIFYFFIAKDSTIPIWSASNKIRITGRSLYNTFNDLYCSSSYESIISKYSRFDFDKLMSDELLYSGLTIEFGTGLSELAVHIAKVKHAKGYSKMVIIEALDYQVLGALVTHVAELFPGRSYDIGPITETTDIILDKINILRNNELIEYYNTKIDGALPATLNRFVARADFVFDILAINHYSEHKSTSTKIISRLLNKTGKLVQV